jgi:short-subunit dehydrogenase
MTLITGQPPSAGSGKSVLITGASSGIGYAAALAFAKRGATVGATARSAERLEALSRAVQGLPGRVVPLVADVRDPGSMQAAASTLTQLVGKLDILVANAGLGQRGPLVEAPWADLEDVLRTNIDGVLHSVRAAVPMMRQNGSGHIVLISSVTAYVTTPYATTYAATKAALNVLGNGLRTELASDHIWVTNLLVGQTHTDFAKNRRGTPGKIQNIPEMSAEQVAEAIVRVTGQRRRQVAIRWFDRLLMVLGQTVPGVMDRLVARSYKG